jgi:hypothetical protein
VRSKQRIAPLLNAARTAQRAIPTIFGDFKVPMFRRFQGGGNFVGPFWGFTPKLSHFGLSARVLPLKR